MDLYYDDVLQVLEDCNSSKCLYEEFTEFLDSRMLNKNICELEEIYVDPLPNAF